jgi:hypothetical protein
MQLSALLRVLVLMGFHDHLPLGKIANHHGAFNQPVSDEMRGFVQTVTLFSAFTLRHALVDLAEVNMPPRTFLAAVALRSYLVKLVVVPVVALEAANSVDTPLLIHACG